ncbi:hypothetical protein Riv7116_0032 [Rivularia sp. PCC 7116]|nr:hypothetical protein Riv7116_0032 [Rivularia sp. PCC 7116]
MNKLYKYELNNLFIEIVLSVIGLTQAANFVVGYCDTLSNVERSNKVFSVTHHPSTVTIAAIPE